MSEHPIQDMLVTAMENLKDMIDVNTIVGDPIETPDKSAVILTVSKVGFGFAAGGSEFNQGSGGQDSDSQSSNLPFGGGTGGGVSITPIAFLVVYPHDIKMIHLDEGTHLVEKLIDLAPQAVDKVQNMIQQNQNQQKQNNQFQNQNFAGGTTPPNTPE
ncbi:GerW family sporulation protein [Alkalibacillus aidingensis]|uniref:GerW family sporulation protein n=1 Tax=Alkalibacillus aidingensis TaxID=2747607 RepID=UPI0016612557|nr:GerW family sporulation protein [Alkalibacillus aidingensis]